jgi:hypothetical protein
MVRQRGLEVLEDLLSFHGLQYVHILGQDCETRQLERSSP